MILTNAELVGAWISIFLTLCIFSYLYDDNPIYKFAEHLFLGVSIGVGIVEQYYGTLKPNLLDALASGQFVRLIPLVLVVLLLLKVAGRQISWVARIPIAFIVAAYAGVKLTGEANANLMRQTAESIPDLQAVYAQHGWVDTSADYAGVLSAVFLLLGLIACLIHFYFSAPQRGAMRYVSRFGVLVLMVSFGASFGYTVMGRISLAIGRMQEMLGYDRAPVEVAAIQPQIASVVSFVLIVVILILWERGRTEEEAPSSDNGA